MSELNATPPANGAAFPQGRRAPSLKVQLEQLNKRLTVLEERDGLFGEKLAARDDTAEGRDDLTQRVDLAEGEIEYLLGERIADRKLARAMVIAVVSGEPLEEAFKKLQEKAKSRDGPTPKSPAGYDARIEKIAKMIRVISKKGGEARSEES